MAKRLHEICVIECQIVPKDMKPGRLYVSRKYETVVHLCCCGCGAKVVTPTGKGGWTLTIRNNGKPTLMPSVGSFQLKCKSHYFIKEGDIVWCGR